MSFTYTYVKLQLNRAAFDEIKTKLEAAGYQHAISKDGQCIDMHGLAIVPEPKQMEGEKQ